MRRVLASTLLLAFIAACADSDLSTEPTITIIDDGGEEAGGNAGSAGSSNQEGGSAGTSAGSAGEGTAGTAGAGESGSGQGGETSAGAGGSGESGAGQGGEEAGGSAGSDAGGNGGAAGDGAGGTAGEGGSAGASGAAGSAGEAGSAGAGGEAGSGGGSSSCPDGIICVDSFPFTHESDTNKGVSVFSNYSCAVTTNEGGPEIIYRVVLDEPGFLSAAVYDGANVDIDVHILSALDATACLSRGDKHAKADVAAGVYYIVADTYVTGAGVPQKGAYRIDIGFIPPSKGPCGMKTGTMPRVNDGGTHLQMPATGPMVKEAHLVTADEPPPYPQTNTDKLTTHYAISQAATGLVMYRDQDWAPKEGGGTFFGAGIGSPTTFPVVDEGWYVNMYWTAAARPARGTRMIMRKPGTNRAVVVAAGYETGPGNLSQIGGTPEETHFYLGTAHLSTLTLGLATDNTLPLGPRVCTD